MNGLRQQARSSFSQFNRFDDSALSFTIVEIIQPSSSPKDSTFNITTVPKSKLLGRLKTDSSQNTPHARLTLVRISRTKYREFPVSAALFLDLFAEFQIEEYFLTLLAQEKGGFQHSRRYHEPSKSSDGAASSASPEGGYTDSCYLNTTSALLLWSFSSHTRTTRAIIIPNHAPTIPDSKGVFESFIAELETHKALVGTSFLVHLSISLVLSSWMDTKIRNTFHSLRDFETYSQHGAWVNTSRPPLELDELVELSKGTGSTMTLLASIPRHTEYILKLLATNPDIGKLESVEDSIAVERPGQSADEDVTMAMRAVRNMIVMREADLSYLQERARMQSSVMLSLVQQKLAKSSLSIAHSTRTDGTAMKMLALMTTLFLPGTFFATLFSVPSLRWSEKSVITERFWIYWAFVLPATILMLVVYKWWVPRRNLQVEK